MGERVKVDVADFGSESVDQGSVTIPTTEKLIGISIQQTADGSWSQFIIKTEYRTIVVEEGTVGVTIFDNICTKVKALFETTEGAELLATLRLLLSANPLKAKIS